MMSATAIVTIGAARPSPDLIRTESAANVAEVINAPRSRPAKNNRGCLSPKRDSEARWLPSSVFQGLVGARPSASSEALLNVQTEPESEIPAAAEIRPAPSTSNPAM